MNVSWQFLLIPFSALLLALALLLISRAIKRSSGMPEGKIVYADPGLWGKPEKPFYDSLLGLTGKPDYLIRRSQTTIPVEVKSMWAPREPYDSHVLQLGAYCLLADRHFGQRPDYGLLRYRNRTFKIPFTSALEEEVLETIQTIRGYKELDEVCRSHDQPNRCARCGFRERCDQRL
ncbi:MAG: Dna2/Cas4 domain-containing protein [Pelolinea sp.]|nr:Dna2/Cas4 domain-containing protein [Pelolinea sp.]